MPFSLIMSFLISSSLLRFHYYQYQVAVLKREVNGDASEAALLKCCELSDGKVTSSTYPNLI